MKVEKLTLQQIMDVRIRVLRNGTPVTHANYVEDSYPDVVHFGILENGIAVATSTWLSKECPGHENTPAFQLKGMAVETSLQSSGYGAALIEAGIAHASKHGAHLVWARARDSALYFYEKQGFTVEGDGFIDGPTGMPHHIVTRKI